MGALGSAGGSFSSAEEGFFPRWLWGNVLKAFFGFYFFFSNFIQKQTIASVPRSLRSCHLARCYRARRLSSSEPPATSAVSLSPPSRCPSSPAAGGAAGERGAAGAAAAEMSAVPRRCAGWVVLPSCQQPAELKLFSRLRKGFFFFSSPSKKDGGDQTPSPPAVLVPAPRFLRCPRRLERAGLGGGTPGTLGR